MFGIAVVLTIFFSFIYSKPKEETIYDVDLNVTLYKDYFEIDSCKAKIEDCNRKVRDRYVEKAKKPNDFKIDYKVGLMEEIEKFIQVGKSTHVNFANVSATSKKSNERIVEVSNQLKRRDDNMESSAFSLHDLFCWRGYPKNWLQSC